MKFGEKTRKTNVLPDRFVMTSEFYPQLKKFDFSRAEAILRSSPKIDGSSQTVF